ncbi:uncharacterized protein EI90DRAFT_3122715 [Cantharellus anzutake]|uniref:uncharacterized protein n=1 Tax=Cantharellus anzutake TaxID=1750568 RepID=UPI0019065F7B|nr:uncharacterized protein EI90DRAFT_3122715 [Cantharellus anzutake]KAF8332284.1 hypothetical protein EI90DRAFT_3122715 [Cantharellus anzutake]
MSNGKHPNLSWNTACELAQTVFESYIQVNRERYRLSNHHMSYFQWNVSWELNEGQLDLETALRDIPERAFTTEMGWMIEMRLVFPLLQMKQNLREISELVSKARGIAFKQDRLTFWKQSDIRDRLGQPSVMMVDYEGHMSPVLVTATEGIQQDENWKSLREAILEQCREAHPKRVPESAIPAASLPLATTNSCTEIMDAGSDGSDSTAEAVSGPAIEMTKGKSCMREAGGKEPQLGAGIGGTHLEWTMLDPLRVIMDQTSVHTNTADNKALDGLQKRATMPMSAFHPAKATTTMSTDSPGTTSSALSPSSNTSPTDSNGHHADPTVPATSSHQAALTQMNLSLLEELSSSERNLDELSGLPTTSGTAMSMSSYAGLSTYLTPTDIQDIIRFADACDFNEDLFHSVLKSHFHCSEEDSHLLVGLAAAGRRNT